MKHKLLFRRFVASLLLLAASTMSWAYDFEVNGIYYNKNSDGKSVEVTYKSTSDRGYSGSVTIPSSVTYEGTTYNVTSIGYAAFFDCSGLTSVTISNSVTTIDENAFFGCFGLTSINIPESVTSISSYAFEGCSSLTSVTIPSSVTSIASSAFRGCSGLTSIVVDANNPNFDNRDNCNAIIETSSNTLIVGCKNTVIPESVTSIRTYAFDGCSGLTSINIPSSVTTIYNDAFRGCSGLTSIVVDANNKRYDSRNGSNAIIETSSNRLITGCKNTVIPESVTEIYDYAFYNCSGLTSITIPESVTSVGERAFSGCSGLTSINIPESVTSISYSAFFGCTSLPVIDNIRYADTYLVGAVDKTNSTYNIKEGTRFIGGSAFRGCSNLMSVTIPNSVTSIGSSAFYGCSGLTSITIPESVTSIGGYAFQNCSGLTSVTINSNAIVSKSYGYSYVDPEGMQRLFGEQVREYIIGDGVTSIGSYAFAGCSNLTSITIPESVTSVELSAFRDCPNLPVIDNIRYADTYLVGAVDKTQSTYNIKDGTRFIGDNAFVGCSALTSITIPESVTSIGWFAFERCSGLTSINIPESVTNIGIYVFAGCTSLPVIDNIRYAGTYLVEAVNKAQSTYNIKEGTRFIGYDAFSGCSALTSITIPESVTSIGFAAFSGCSALTSITIPESVTSIDDYVFNGCSALTSVTCLVTKSDRSTDGIVEPVEPMQPVKPLPGVDPATLTSSDYLYPFNPAHPDDPTTANVDETVDVTIDNVYPADECKAKWLDYYKKVYNNRTATSKTNTKWTNLLYNPYIKRNASELVLMLVYQFEWSQYIADLDYFEYGYARELAGYNCLKRLGYYPMPSTNGSTFVNVPLSDATLYVHEDVIGAYKITAPWSEFGRILTIESTAVDELKAKAPQEEGDTDAPIYDLMGRRLTEKPASGLYIQNGKKYLVK